MKSSNGRLDPETGSAIGVDIVENEMHNCEHFYIFGTDTMGSGDEKFVVIIIPSEKHFRFRWDISSTASFETALYKNPTYTGGTDATIFNSRVDCTNPSNATVKMGVSVTDYGTQIDGARWGERRQGGSSNIGDGLILTEGTYLRHMKSNAASNEVTFKAYWSEHNS